MTSAFLSKSNSVYIDPENCGSSVGYRLAIEEYTNVRSEGPTYTLRATIDLADCNHKIGWELGQGGEEDDLSKIDNAINTLKEFRKEFLLASKQLEKLKLRGKK